MDPVTHTLSALVLARTGLGRLAPSATAALVVAANVPDIDSPFLLARPSAYLACHPVSHSLAGAAVLGAAVALAFWSRARLRSTSFPQKSAGQVGGQAQPHLLRNLLVASLLGTVSHLLLDWSTPEGTAWLWPVKSTPYTLDWFAYVDLWLIVILLLGVAVPALFGLIAEEIGARRSERGRRQGAWVALLACAALTLGRASLHGEGVAQLESRMYRARMPLRAAAFPLPLSPFRWHGVVETEETYETVELILVGPRRGVENPSTFYKPVPSPALEAALTTRSARVFLAGARFPYAQITPAGGGWRIRLEDLRTAAEAPGPGRFILWIDVNPKLEAESEALRWGGREEAPP